MGMHLFVLYLRETSEANCSPGLFPGLNISKFVMYGCVFVDDRFDASHSYNHIGHYIIALPPPSQPGLFFHTHPGCPFLSHPHHVHPSNLKPQHVILLKLYPNLMSLDPASPIQSTNNTAATTTTTTTTPGIITLSKSNRLPAVPHIVNTAAMTSQQPV